MLRESINSVSLSSPSGIVKANEVIHGGLSSYVFNTRLNRNENKRGC
jgi:hypothetical protein